eukprot:1866367-Rhodomonas_salina.1
MPAIKRNSKPHGQPHTPYSKAQAQRLVSVIPMMRLPTSGLSLSFGFQLDSEVAAIAAGGPGVTVTVTRIQAHPSHGAGGCWIRLGPD